MKLSFLYGLTAGQWWQVLRESGFAVHPSQLHHALTITTFSLLNSLMAVPDRRVDLSGVSVKAPIFILGHWRSGTTHLHYLLDQDPRLTTPNTYEVSFPHSFLRTERWHRPLLAPLAPRSRPQDSMRFSLTTPNEDEIGLTPLCLRTPYMGWAFPDQADRHMGYLSFRDEPEAEQVFADALVRFMKKLTLLRPGRTLVMKSPGHTARIRLILRLFPDARFVHIHRDPYRVFRSSLHLYQSWFSQFAFLQRPSLDGIEERILSLYADLYEAFFAQEHLLPSDRTHTIRYDDLTADPLGELRRLYDGIGLTDFPRDALETYLSSVEDYQRNTYPPMDAALKAQIAQRWARNFAVWGYPT